jgi:hypothetical protein
MSEYGGESLVGHKLPTSAELRCKWWLSNNTNNNRGGAYWMKKESLKVRRGVHSRILPSEAVELWRGHELWFQSAGGRLNLSRLFLATPKDLSAFISSVN